MQIKAGQIAADYWGQYIRLCTLVFEPKISVESHQNLTFGSRLTHIRP